MQSHGVRFPVWGSVQTRADGQGFAPHEYLQLLQGDIQAIRLGTVTPACTGWFTPARPGDPHPRGALGPSGGPSQPRVLRAPGHF